MRTIGKNERVPNGVSVLCVGPYCWGKAPTPAGALRRARENLPARFRKTLGKEWNWHYVLIPTPGSLWDISPFGEVSWKCEACGKRTCQDHGDVTVS
jgi:hypothetical protein